VPFIFEIEPGVSVADEAFVREGINIAASYFAAQLNWMPTNTVTVVVSAGASGSSTATAARDKITVYTGSKVWPTTAGDLKRKIVSHELFHVVQYSINWPFGTYIWLTEGSAEYVGYQVAVISRGIENADQTRGCHQFSVVHSSPPIPALQQLEGSLFYDINNQGATTYSLGYLAAERLTQSAGLASFTQFTSQSAFQTVFSTSLSEFYTAFEQYRSTWRPPANYTCLF